MNELQELKDELAALNGAFEAAEQDKENLQATFEACNEELQRTTVLLKRALIYIRDMSDEPTLIGTDVEDEIGFTEDEYDDIMNYCFN